MGLDRTDSTVPVSIGKDIKQAHVFVERVTVEVRHTLPALEKRKAELEAELAGVNEKIDEINQHPDKGYRVEEAAPIEEVK